MHRIIGEFIHPLRHPRAQVQALAALPPKQELLAKLVGSLNAPLYGLVMVLSGNQSGLVRVLNSIREKKSADQPAAA